MAQPANRRRPLGIDAFWDKPTPHPPLRWEKGRIQYRLALLAKENNILDILLGPKHEMVDLPLEPIYEETIVVSSAQSERERNARNPQQKSNWQNKCQRLIETGIISTDEPWPLVDWKTVSLHYLSIGVEGRILYCINRIKGSIRCPQRNSGKIVAAAFSKPGNITFDRHFFLITKQL